MKEFIDSREAYPANEPTPADWAEYNEWLETVEEKEDTMREFVTDCDYCGKISLCHEDEGHGTCCRACAEAHDEYEDDGQPTMYEEYQDLYGGDDWDHGQYDCEW